VTSISTLLAAWIRPSWANQIAMTVGVGCCNTKRQTACSEAETELFKGKQPFAGLGGELLW
jgi:hypothetical protein